MAARNAAISSGRSVPAHSAAEAIARAAQHRHLQPRPGFPAPMRGAGRMKSSAASSTHNAAMPNASGR